MSTLDRQALEERMISYLLGELPAQESRSFEELVASDPVLAEDVERLRRTLGLIPFAAAADPPAELRDRVIGAVARRERTEMRPARRGLRVAFAALAAGIALAIGIDDYRVRRELALLREVTEVLQQPNVVVAFELSGTGSHARSTGAAVLDLDAKRAALVVRGLPVLPNDRVYRLWARVGDRQIACGEFSADASGRIARQFSIPVQEYTEPVHQLIVTVESYPLAPTAAGPTVMVSS
jgi:anti-sigma-K factor RskA